MPKPIAFVGSSSEGLDVARAIQVNLADLCEVLVWTQGPFRVGQVYIESLHETDVGIELKGDHVFVVFEFDDIDFQFIQSRFRFRNKIVDQFQPFILFYKIF